MDKPYDHIHVIVGNSKCIPGIVCQFPECSQRTNICGCIKQPREHHFNQSKYRNDKLINSQNTDSKIIIPIEPILIDDSENIFINDLVKVDKMYKINSTQILPPSPQLKSIQPTETLIHLDNITTYEGEEEECAEIIHSFEPIEMYTTDKRNDEKIDDTIETPTTEQLVFSTNEDTEIAQKFIEDFNKSEMFGLYHTPNNDKTCTLI